MSVIRKTFLPFWEMDDNSGERGVEVIPVKRWGKQFIMQSNSIFKANASNNPRYALLPPSGKIEEYNYFDAFLTCQCTVSE